MQTLWKRRDVANLVVITALVILAICRNLTTFERKGAGPELYHKFMSTHIADAAKLAKKLDTLTTIVTFCSDDFGEALLGAFIGYECRAKQVGRQQSFGNALTSFILRRMYQTSQRCSLASSWYITRRWRTRSNRKVSFGPILMSC